VTILAHGSVGHQEIETLLSLAAIVTLVGVAPVYAALAALRGREPRGWNQWRTASFLIGIALAVLALRPASSDDFGDHMVGHLLIGMFAPLALVLAAPVTLILRSVSTRTGKGIVHALRSPPARILTNPLLLLVANLGGLALLYFTPFYTVTATNLALHELVHIHFFATGYLFAWMIAGADPGPDRPTVPIRIVVLGVAVLGHSVIAQLLYAGLFVRIPVSGGQLRDAGTLMYYWGDIAEILLALAMLLTWRPQAHRACRRPVVHAGLIDPGTPATSQ
jgi:putative membrane protein